MKKALYGTWNSIITPELVSGGANLPWETKIDQECCFWTEQRPQEQGRGVVVKWSPTDGLSTLTPPGYSVRTKVYVYGGSAYCIDDQTLWFVNDSDQCIYSQDLFGSTPVRLTEPGFKFAELLALPDGLIAVSEDSNEITTIAFIDRSSGNVTPILFGADFYSSPQLNHDKSRLAWLEWNHPNMPWDETTLWVGDLIDGKVINRIQVAGGSQESVTQPLWNTNGALGYVSDKTGWWNLYEWDGTQSTAIYDVDTEFGVPQWRFNTTWGYNSETNSIVAAYKVPGGWDLGCISKEHRLKSFDFPFNSYSQIKVVGSKILFLAGSATKSFGVYLWNGSTLQQLNRDLTVIPDAWISRAIPFTFATKGNQTGKAYGYFYPPTNPEYEMDGPPPVIVKIHGGPTGAAEMSMRPVIQFWTSRGFALFDVDYTGSTGYGRVYRDALKGMWGIADCQDILCGVDALIAKGMIDPSRVYISGSSAGGFTLLRALIEGDVFTKAVCYYGVSDLEALVKETHKFEKHYLDQLIAPYPEKRNIYIERSPINHIDKIKASMLIFQGTDDRVVPPDQSQALFDSLQKKGIPSQLVLYEHEGHGFRKETTLLDTLTKELQFFCCYTERDSKVTT